MNREELINDPQTAIDAALDGRQSRIWTAMPGIIVRVDYTKMVCDIRLAILGIQNTSNPQTILNAPYPLLVNVPIVFPQAGGFVLTLPIIIGNEVLVVFASRCIDSWWQNGAPISGSDATPTIPLDYRFHDLSDGFAIPGPCSVPNVIPNISTTDAQLRNTAGTTYVSITSDGKIKLVSPSEIDITAPTVKVTGAFSATTITSGTTVLATHEHSGVTTGGGTSGPPI